MQSQQPAPTPDEIWRILREVSASQKRLAEDREKQRREQAAEQKRRDEKWEKQRRELAEIHKKQAEAWEKQRAKERKQQAERNRRIDKKIEEIHKAVDESYGTIEMAEDLLIKSLVSQLQERGLKVTRTSQNETGFIITVDRSGRMDRRDYEIDIGVKNAEELVAVKITASLEKGNVDSFLYVLENFHEMFPEYQRMRISGAVAYLSEKEGLAAYAESKGLFVIKAVGDSSHIINKKSFKPKIFCSP